MKSVRNSERSCDLNTPPRAGRFRNSVWRGALGEFRRSEEGAVTSFSLFIFLMMLFVGGMAVDLMRFETRRSALQNTLDASTLAATNLRSESDAKQLVVDIMAKRGYTIDPSDVTVNEIYTGGDPNDPSDNGELVSRSVSAKYDLRVDTLFMPLLGIEHIGTTGSGGAKEGLSTVEISLVVDISNSMNSEGRLDDLKVAAKNFIDQVIDPTRTDMPVTVSVIPFNHAVVAPEDLLKRLNTHGSVEIPVADRAPYNWANPMQAYQRTAFNPDDADGPGSQCVRFSTDQMVTSNLEEDLDPSLVPSYLKLRAIGEDEELDMMGYYAAYWGAGGSSNTGTPPTANSWDWRCNPDFYPAILPWETDADTLKTYIQNLVAHGNTSADTGLKWGVAMLDPAMRNVVQDMVDANELRSTVAGRPYDYDPSNFMKVVVLMTDGANTRQHDIKDKYKSGPSTVWYSNVAANDYWDTDDDGDLDDVRTEYMIDNSGGGYRGRYPDGNPDRQKRWYDGYFVERPGSDPDRRWLRTHSLTNYSDGELLAMADLPEDAVQLDWTDVFDRFSAGHAGLLHYDENVSGAYDAWNELYNSDYYTVNNDSDGIADERMIGDPDTGNYGLCDAAKVNNDILVYTIAFKAGEDAEAILQDCATTQDGYYFKASSGDALYEAFSKIAVAITKLRLTQ